MKNYTFDEGLMVEVTETEILDILKFKNKLLKSFKNDTEVVQKIKRSIMKLLITCITPPEPFKNKKMDVYKVSKLIISTQILSIKQKFETNNKVM
jgi:hypothetical protein